MKKSILLTLAIAQINLIAVGQDLILTIELDEIESKVTEITPDLIKYKKWNNQDGPTYSIEKGQVFKIKYSNGSSEIITKPGVVAQNSTSTSASSNSPASGGFDASAFKSNSEYFLNQPYLVDQASGNILKLEKGTPELQTKTVAAPFYASSSTSWKMIGDRSNIRLSSGGGYFFVIKVAPGLDPSDHVKLKRFDLVKRSRRDKTLDRHIPNTKYTGSVYGGGSENIDKNDVVCSYESLGGGAYKVIPSGLSAGNEYTFYILHKFYAFGID